MSRWLYNGKELPILPTSDLPYAFITEITLINTTYYTLYLCESAYAAYHTGLDGTWSVLAEGVLKSGMIKASATEWGTLTAYGSPLVQICSYDSGIVLWSNHSFPGPNGEDWITASDPVPVQPYTPNPAAMLMGFQLGTAIRRNRT